MRNVIIGAIAVAVMASTAAAVPAKKAPAKTAASAAPKPPSDLESLVIAAARDEIRSESDPFAPSSIDMSKMGRPFHLVFPLNSDVSFFTYEGGTLRLVLPRDRSSIYLNGSTTEAVRFQSIEFMVRENRGASYVGQNAYGAKAVIRVVNRLRGAVAMIDGPEPTGKPSDYGNYEFSQSLPGPQAKAIALDAQIVVDGVIAPLSPTRAVGCSSNYAEPTISSPTEVSIKTCYAGAKVSRIAFQRRSTGEIIKEWKNEILPATGPILFDDVRLGMTTKQFAILRPNTPIDRGNSFATYTSNDEVVEVRFHEYQVSMVELTVPDDGRMPSRFATFAGRYGPPTKSSCNYPDMFCSQQWTTTEGILVEFNYIKGLPGKVLYRAPNKRD